MNSQLRSLSILWKSFWKKLASQGDEEQYRSVLENALDPVLGVDDQGRIIYWNSQATHVFGWKASEVFGENLVEVMIPERLRARHHEFMKNFLQTGSTAVLNQRIEVLVLRKEGSEFPIELSITPVRSKSGLHFYAFLRDISTRKKDEEDRRKLLQHLEETVRRRDEFISIASHELKTPLTSLRLQFQMASRQIQSGDDRAYAAESVKKRIIVTNRQIDRMLHLIDGMLDISRIATGRLHLDASTVDFSALVNEMVERFSDQWIISESTVRADVEEGVFVRCDPYRIEQVISNLATNTIKYGAGAPVDISLRKSEGKAYLLVRDHGIGIAEDDQKRVFERFERAVPASSISGLGLGLYITRQILELHVGKISVQSELGKGSTFLVELPLDGSP